MIEVNTLIRLITHYIKAGYRHNPQQKLVYMHLSPLLHQIWSSALDSKNPEDKSLEELTELVTDEVKLRMPKHQTRMSLIETKRAQSDTVIILIKYHNFTV